MNWGQSGQNPQQGFNPQAFAQQLQQQQQQQQQRTHQGALDGQQGQQAFGQLFQQLTQARTQQGQQASRDPRTNAPEQQQQQQQQYPFGAYQQLPQQQQLSQLQQLQQLMQQPQAQRTGQQLVTQLTPQQQQQLTPQQLQQLLMLAQQVQPQTAQFGQQAGKAPTGYPMQQQVQPQPQQQQQQQLLLQKQQEQQQLMQRLQLLQQQQQAQLKQGMQPTQDQVRMQQMLLQQLSQNQMMFPGLQQVQQQQAQQQPQPTMYQQQQQPQQQQQRATVQQQQRRDMQQRSASGAGDMRGRQGGADRRRRSPPRSPKRRSPPPQKAKRRSKSKSPPPVRARSKSPPKHRDRSPERRYSILISPYSVIQFERDYQEIKRRYPRLQISDDFAKLVASWVVEIPHKMVPINYPPIYCDYLGKGLEEKKDESATVQTTSPTQTMIKKYNAKVMLMSGGDNAVQLSSSSKSSHLSNHIKFLVAKQERSDLMCIGGPWSSALDGSDPEYDSSVLIRTAIRWVKEWANLDLSGVTKWLKFMEIHYQRPKTPLEPEHQEITVIYLPDISEILPPLEKFNELWIARQNAKKERKEKQKKEEAEKKAAEAAAAGGGQSSTPPQPGTEQQQQQPSESTEESKQDQEQESKPQEEKTTTITPAENKPIGLFVQSSKPECILISLDGLLDYNESDKHEKTMEVSLFAELFHELLQRDYGEMILESILKLPDDLSRFAQEKKRKQSESDDVSTVKKEEDSSHPTDQTITEITPTEQLSEGGINLEEQQQESTATDQPKATENAQKEQQVTIDHELLKAFQYFDRNGTGYIKSDDLEMILHNLGKCLSRYWVHSLITSKLDSSRKIYYKKLVESTTPIVNESSSSDHMKE